MRTLQLVMLVAATVVGTTSCQDGLATDAGPAALVYESGPEAGPPGTLLPEPLVVKVVDRSGAPVEGVELRWAIAAGGGSLERTATRTDAEGQSRNTYRMPSLPNQVSLVRVEATGLAIGVVEFGFATGPGEGGGGGGAER